MSSGPDSEATPPARSRTTRPSRLRNLLKVGGLIVGAVVLLFGAALGTVLYATFEDVEDPVDGARVGPATTVVDGYVACFVLEAGDRTVVLIDACEDLEATALRETLARMGYAPGDVSAVLLTHGHGDHRGGLVHFPEARVFAHEDELPLLRGETRAEGPIPWLSGHAAPLEVTDPVRDGESFEIGELHVKVFHVPGHTPGSVAWLVGETLFLGDSATSVETGALEPSPWVFTGDTEQNRRSLRALAAELETANAEVERLVFSHAAPLRGLEPLRDFAAEGADAP